jgi:hypothetical protein
MLNVIGGLRSDIECGIRCRVQLINERFSASKVTIFALIIDEII